MTRSNLDITPNVMVVQDKLADELRYLPGDLAVAVYGRDRFGTPQLIERGLSARQHVEYLQYLRCVSCGNTCAGTCGA